MRRRRRLHRSPGHPLRRRRRGGRRPWRKPRSHHAIRDAFHGSPSPSSPAPPSVRALPSALWRHIRRPCQRRHRRARRLVRLPVAARRLGHPPAAL